MKGRNATKVAAILVLVLLAPAQLVQPSGSGSYPPPASGDWDITMNTTVANETIQLAGDLTVLSGTLTLDNVTIIGNLPAGWFNINVTQNGTLIARNCTFATGIAYDLNCEWRGRTELYGCKILQGQGGVWIAAGGSNLTLKDCVAEATLGFWGGSPVLDGTVFRNVFNGVMCGPGTYIGNASFDNCTTGLFAGNNSTVYGCTFRNCTTGLEVRNNVTLRWSYFGSCDVGCAPAGGGHNGSNLFVEHTDFRDCRIGLTCGPGAYLYWDSNFRRCDVGAEVLGDCAMDRASFLDCGLGVLGRSGADLDLRGIFWGNDTRSMELETGTSAYVWSGLIMPFADNEGAFYWTDANLTINHSDFYYDHRGYFLNGEGGNLSLNDSEFHEYWQVLSARNLTKGTVANCTFDRLEVAPARPVFSVGGEVEIRDCSIPVPEETLTTLEVVSGTARLFNTSVARTDAIVNDGATLEAYWYLDARTRYLNGTSAVGVNVTVTDKQDGLVFSAVSTAGGKVPRAEVMECSRTGNVTADKMPCWVNASLGNLGKSISANIDRSMALFLDLKDVSIPWVSIDSPANGTLLNASAVTLRGRAGDASSITEMRFNPDDKGWIPMVHNAVNGSYSWNITVGLGDGRHTIVVEALDDGGNIASASITVDIDTKAPALNVTAPAPDALVNKSRLDIIGSTEPGGFLDINGEAVPVFAGNFTWDILLNEGPNDISVSARDAAGNTNTTTLHVTLDTIPPALTVSFPTEGQITNIPMLNISGTVEPGVKMLVGSESRNITGSFYLFSVNLVEGENRISIMAEDAAGNRNMTVRLVTLDTLEPVLSVDTLNGSKTNLSTLRLAGWTDAGSEVTVNGQIVPVGTDGRFITNISLVSGNNTISITARDRAGNTASLTRVVERVTDTPKPPPVPRPPGGSLSLTMVAGAVLAVAVLLLAAFAVLSARGRQVIVELELSSRAARPSGRRVMPPLPVEPVEKETPEPMGDEDIAEPSVPTRPKGEYGCLECGAKVPAGSLSCPECGAEDTKAAMEGKKVMECPLCGKMVAEDAPKCPGCGAEFEDE